ncbi:MAG: hypothetical protein FJW26_19670 [Acidimicrobiia bacterium]|nr:hypothetical protein [Acidimicrobiia bacterium]
MIPRPKRVGRPVQYPRREIINAPIMHRVGLLAWCLVHKSLCTKVRQILFVSTKS